MVLPQRGLGKVYAGPCDPYAYCQLIQVSLALTKLQGYPSIKFTGTQLYFMPG